MQTVLGALGGTTLALAKSVLQLGDDHIDAYFRDGLGRLTVNVTAKTTVLNLHKVDFTTVTIPGSVCHAPGQITLHGSSPTYGTAVVQGSADGPVDVGASADRVVFGDLDGDGRDEAALNVVCEVLNSGTAAGQTSEASVVFTGAGGTLHVVGVVVPTQPKAAVGAHVPLVEVVEITKGQVVANEAWYASQDADCCSSMHMVTTWTLSGGQLTPGAPRSRG
ncbi:MAG: hypothetical protein M3256_22695 [Actinomycetota bacterium]|nr:hypothetical protein [Actinomycetota bacterium]